MTLLSGELLTKLGGLASGVTLATLTVLPPSPSTASVVRFPAESISFAVTTVTVHEGLESGFGSSSFVLHPWLHGSPKFVPINTKGPGNGGEGANLAHQLKDVSGLGVVTLAKISGVSRTRYHKWLKGEGVGPDKVPHMQSLIALFRDLRPILGSDMRGFVRSQSPAGRIEDLLLQGETQAVMGLATYPSAGLVRRPNRPSSADKISGLPGWIKPTRRLAWDVPDAGSEYRQFTLDEFGASWPGPDVYLIGADAPENDDPAGIVHVVYEA